MSSERAADVAVVVVNYNAGDYLARCLRSVLARAGDVAVDLLVIDNASADGSVEAAAAAVPDARIVRNVRNFGLSKAWNQGIRATGAPFAFLLNPDAELWEGTLADLVKLARELPRAAVLGPLIRNADGTVYPSGRKIPSIAEAVGHAFLGPFAPNNRYSRAYTLEGWDRSTEREVDWVSGSAWLVRRAALEEVGLFDEDFFLYGEELDLCTRLRAAGWTIVFTPAVEVLHEGGVSTGRSPRMHRLHSASIYRYFRKHRVRGWRRALLPLAWLALRARAKLVSLRERRR